MSRFLITGGAGFIGAHIARSFLEKGHFIRILDDFSNGKKENLRFLKQYPKAREVRLSYARLLVAEHKYTEARAEFQTLSKDFPDNADVVFAVVALSLQLQDYAQAEANFKRLLALAYHDKNTVRLYLGQIAEEQKDFPEALRWYDEVTGGPLYLQAQIRYALVLNKEGKLDAARAQRQQGHADSCE